MPYLRNLDPFLRPFSMLGLAMLLAAALAGVPQSAQAQSTPPPPFHLVIGIDVSTGSPFVTDMSFSEKVAKRIAEAVEALPVRAKLSIRSFSAHGLVVKELDVDRQITARQSAERTAVFVETLISKVPQLAENGQITVNPQSDILGFLYTMSRAVDCEVTETVFILATDGFEESEYAKLTNGDTLPVPDGAPFASCARLEMLGLGRRGGSPTLTNKVIGEWTSWAEKAGFETFIGLDSW